MICTAKSLSRNSLHEREPFHRDNSFESSSQGIIARAEPVRCKLSKAFLFNRRNQIEYVNWDMEPGKPDSRLDIDIIALRYFHRLFI